jgi:hypothetical protein
VKKELTSGSLTWKVSCLHCFGQHPRANVVPVVGFKTALNVLASGAVVARVESSAGAAVVGDTAAEARFLADLAGDFDAALRRFNTG